MKEDEDLRLCNTLKVGDGGRTADNVVVDDRDCKMNDASKAVIVLETVTKEADVAIGET